MNKIKTEYCTIKSHWGIRQVRYLTCGSGPLIFLLHQSPKSADEYRPLIEQWANDFTIIAPDTPGYGDSDPLNTDEVTIEKIAQATIELADALGINKFGLYGFHTGAIISIAIGYSYPNRVKAMACNGVLVLSDDELKNIRDNYLPAYHPKWDGSHLAWLWSRMREQLIFFPWHQRTEESRIQFDISSPEVLQENAVEVMRAGDAYRQAYGAAFEYRLEQFVPELTVPALITAGESDPLCKCLDQLTPSDSVRIHPSKTHEEALEKAREILLNHPADSSFKIETDTREGAAFTKTIFHSMHGDIKIEKNSKTTSQPLLCIHPPGGSSKTIRFLTESIDKDIPIVSIDLPGHGESSKEPIQKNPLNTHTDVISEIVQKNGLNQLTILGMQASCSSVMHTAKMITGSLNKIILIEPWILSEKQISNFIELGLPEIKPEWSGGHLQQYWHMVRDSKLFWPWYNRSISGIIEGSPNLDEKQLDIEVTELIRSDLSWRETTSDLLQYPIRDSLSEIELPIIICGRSSHPLEKVYMNIEQKLENTSYFTLDHNSVNWASKISKLI